MGWDQLAYTSRYDIHVAINLSTEYSVKAKETVSTKYCKGPQTLTDHKRQFKPAAYTRNVNGLVGQTDVPQ